MLYHILSNEKSKLLTLDNIGFSDDPNIVRFGPGRRNNFLIHYVISGKGVFNGTPLHTGQGFLITPQSYEHYFPDPQDPWKLLWITSHDSNVTEIFDSFNADAETNVFEYGYAEAADALTDFLRKNHNKFYSASEILEIFLNLYNHRKKAETHGGNIADIYCEYAESYISSNIFRRVSVGELTEILGISQPYLYRIFMQKFGLSPKQYIDKTKLNKSKELLTDTEMTVSDVARSVGITDPLVFSAFFKRKTGVTPSEYKKIYG